MTIPLFQFLATEEADPDRTNKGIYMSMQEAIVNAKIIANSKNKTIYVMMCFAIITPDNSQQEDGQIWLARRTKELNKQLNSNGRNQ